MAEEHCIANRYNVVLSTTLRTPEAAQNNLELFRKAGYRVEVVAMAVHEATSRLSVLSRYQQELDDVGFGRNVPDAFQRDAYAGLLSALDHIDTTTWLTRCTSNCVMAAGLTATTSTPTANGAGRPVPAPRSKPAGYARGPPTRFSSSGTRPLTSAAGYRMACVAISSTSPKRPAPSSRNLRTAGCRA
ncbi:zeta toxin family protein [Actinoplanes auranticolor]|uniref:UDP-N-acetylglucosamine kinase n=1 Tax=Actinoplanes auranticolor TaxID=47988 RepID=A0A919SV50_9ACTN|nr:zeta toxin family protein [Actinoplanes auranticolor]GIM77618.1 hypothetical protein Aau02nite_76840 [Actinoplanes auranticolor]